MTDRPKSSSNLRVRQKATDLTPEARQSAGNLPPCEHSTLADQLRRAAVSVRSNITGGQDRRHTRESLQHLSKARGSLAEIERLLQLAVRLGYFAQEEQDKVQQAIREVRVPLFGLIERLQVRQ